MVDALVRDNIKLGSWEEKASARLTYDARIHLNIACCMHSYEPYLYRTDTHVSSPEG